ncbi:hypothetical protein [Candidatus Finniella inopinata]|uniref:Uncharacterized protein n=1 Tax=Candidatus Finniella inopinata TaxID=1696036 RepID=A0A4Q7DNX2_9PROT|nr:hypothetical protein [Candidatus Finniella inopinata]RZI46636.1 hypothetical protein EQU50_03360 [Candidatus Finniella inopinata]
MSNPHIEMMKQNRFQQKAGQTASRAGVQNLGLLGAMAKQGHDIQANAPDPRNDMADLLGKAGKEVTGNRPARGWRALLSGMLAGAAAGLKGKVSQEKKEQAEKVGRVFEWLEANGMAMAEKNKQHELKMQAEEELEPLLKDYSQNMMTMAPLAKEKYAEHILGRLNEITGSDYELSSIDQVNPLKITVKSPSNGNALFVQDFSKRVGGVNADLYQKAVDFESQKFSQENQRIAIAQQNTEGRWNPQKQFEVGLGKEGAKKLVDSIKKAEQENATLEDVLYATKEARDLLSSGKVIAGSDLSAYLQRLTGKAFNTEGMTATQLYDTAAAQLYEFAKGNISFGNTNQKEFEFLTSRIPESSKTPKALAMMLDRFEKKIERKMAKNEALISKIPDYSQGLESRSAGLMPQGGTPQAGGQSGIQEQQRTFKVKAPNGAIVLVPESEIDDAISHGGTVVQ